MRSGLVRSARLLAVVAGCAAPARGADAGVPAAEDARIVHALNRLAYGPRPGDVDKVRAIGLEAWIETQLHPERLSDVKIEARLSTLRTVDLSIAELRKGYEVPADVKREIKDKAAAMGDDPSEDEMRAAKRQLAMELAPRLEGRPQLVIDELQEAKLLRAVYSERQLDEVLVDFWMNHFNVFAGKSLDRYLLSEYERETIRPHAWGRFEELLKATAESPAMLFYLDNWLSADPNAKLWGEFSRRRPRRPEPAQNPFAKKRGLNENYAREIMELHTLGVDGGYTQKDVTEVARCFTGWTIRGLRGKTETPGEDPEFAFVAALHDHGNKVVLGQVIRGGGKEEGDRVLHLLATQPATARFIALKLARRFVADEPPAALVERAAETFRKTDGEIRAVVRTIVTSPEFMAPETRSVKIKTPLEFVASSLRAAGANVLDARELARRLAEMGMPLYMQQPPTGYKDVAEAWVSTSGLLARLNFALDLAGGRLSGTLVDARILAPGVEDAARVAGMRLGSPEFQRK